MSCSCVQVSSTGRHVDVFTFPLLPSLLSVTGDEDTLITGTSVTQTSVTQTSVGSSFSPLFFT